MKSAQNFFAILFVICTSLFAEEGISQANIYRNNSGLQWQLAMESLEGFQFDTHDQVLDVGCGDGKITAFVSEKVPEGMVIGLDVSEKMISAATSQFAKGNLLFLKGTAEKIPFEERFDKVISFSTLHWVLDQKKALQSMREGLKQDGTMLLVLPAKSPNNLGILGEKIACSEKWRDYFPSFRKERAYYTPEEYTDILNEADLEVVTLKMFQGVANYKDRTALIGWITPLINFIDHLPLHLQSEFIAEIANQMLLIEPPASNGTISIHFNTMQIIAKKSN